jgi:putative ABC transport system permease protein
VTRRTNEFGIRLTLDAARNAILWEVLRESWTLVAIGAAIGIRAGMVVTRFLSSLLYDVTATDLRVFAGTGAGMFLVAFVAALRPAWRALRVDPLDALRYQ